MSILKVPNIYTGNYGRLIFIPIILIIICLFFIPNIEYGVDLKGGTLITLQLGSAADETALRDALSGIGIIGASIKTYQNPAGYVAEIEMATDERISELDNNLELFDKTVEETGNLETTIAQLKAQYDLNQNPELLDEIEQAEKKLEEKTSEAKQLGLTIAGMCKDLGADVDVTAIGQIEHIKKLKTAVEDVYVLTKNKYKEGIMAAISGVADVQTFSIDEVSPTLSRVFIDKVFQIAIVSAILAIVVVFLVFRTFVPSAAVIIGAVSDIIIALGVMGIFGIPLTLASFAALMMLVGLSLDTDMMLTIKTIKRAEATPRERAHGAMRTGFAMTTTTMAAFFALFILGLTTRIPIYYQIGAVAVAGMIGDLIATWCLNAVIVLLYLEGKFTPLGTRLRGGFKGIGGGIGKGIGGIGKGMGGIGSGIGGGVSKLKEIKLPKPKPKPPEIKEEKTSEAPKTIETKPPEQKLPEQPESKPPESTESKVEESKPEIPESKPETTEGEGSEVR